MDTIKKTTDILIEYDKIIFAYIFGSFVQNKMKIDIDIDIAIYLEKNLETNEYLRIKQ